MVRSKDGKDELKPLTDVSTEAPTWWIRQRVSTPEDSYSGV